MKKITWTYEKRKIDDLIENKDNPRSLSKKRAQELKGSLEDFGTCEAPVVQPDGRIIGGHQRLRMLRAIGVDEVYVSIPSRELTDREAKRLTIILNKVRGEFDLDILANRWELDILLESGYTKEELYTDIIPQEKPKTFSINIKFDNQDDLKFIEGELNTILCDFPSATMKVRCK